MYRIFWLRNKLLRETSKEEKRYADSRGVTRRAGAYYCIKPTKPGEPLLFLKTGKYADRKPRLWNPELEDILAGDWILTTGYPTGSLGGEDAAGDAAQQVEAERAGPFQNR